MVSTEPNVAYDGTSSDLGFGAASYFKPNADFDDLYASMLSPNSTDPLYNSEPMNSLTVSPQELMMTSMDSVPSSTAFPDLTPGSDMLETPNTSPMFADSMTPADFDWSPLFGEDSGFADFESPAAPAVSGKDSTSFADVESPAAPVMSRQDSTSSQIVIHPGGQPRKPSIEPASASPLSFGSRLSTVAGVRKKAKPLPEIVVDGNDPAAVKRARNTAAARKSREKKTAHVDTLVARIVELEAMLAARDAELAQLKGQNSVASGQDFDLSALI